MGNNLMYIRFFRNHLRLRTISLFILRGSIRSLTNRWVVLDVDSAYCTYECQSRWDMIEPILDPSELSFLNLISDYMSQLGVRCL